MRKFVNVWTLITLTLIKMEQIKLLPLGSTLIELSFALFIGIWKCDSMRGDEQNPTGKDKIWRLSRCRSSLLCAAVSCQLEGWDHLVYE